MSTTESQEYTLEAIINDMYAESDMPDTERQQTVAEVIDMITESAVLRGLESAGESVQSAFEKLLIEKPDENRIDTFIQENIPNFPALVLEEVKMFQSMGEEQTTER